eukprot:gnl/TRDRNA2_/TRDRNA2_141335_c0_seq2.p1 gnl/TRDRNA2_/TRDRNA2_141335_c0~~gnl/TRDRNA2_/TRDRNA2_141335_c0_seq2.p1  ORF type:complete len:597 (+),score=90.51 gnl/TRDRNA2_/TRDRNA2_141335_c0_seq2:35-1825(+)
MEAEFKQLLARWISEQDELCKGMVEHQMRLQSLLLQDKLPGGTGKFEKVATSCCPQAEASPCSPLSLGEKAPTSRPVCNAVDDVEGLTNQELPMFLSELDTNGLQLEDTHVVQTGGAGHAHLNHSATTRTESGLQRGSKRLLKQTTKELLVRDVRAHWRKMIRKKPSKKGHGGLKNSTGAEANDSCLYFVVHSRAYELCIMFLVILNSAFIGWQTHDNASREARGSVAQREDVAEFIHVTETGFTILFTVELLVRMISEGSDFVRSKDCTWNAFDSLVVSLMVVEQLLALVTSKSSSILTKMSMLRILRVFRIVRILRIIRVLKFFRELRMMVYSIYGSLKSLMWVMMLLGMLFFMFGIILTQGTTDHCTSLDSWHSAQSAELVKYFGTLDRSILSLYEAMSGGVDWALMVEALQDISWIYVSIFLMFISFAIFGVVNVVTGIFVENALQSAQKDTDVIIQEDLRMKEKYLESLTKAFEEMDTDRSGEVGLKEFISAFEDDKLLAYFNALGLDVSDVQTLFLLLDRDHTGSINIEEFSIGCMRLKGEARSLDIAKLSFENEYIMRGLDAIRERLEKADGNHGTFSASLFSSSRSDS